MQKFIRISIIVVLGGMLMSCHSSQKYAKKGNPSSKTTVTPRQPGKQPTAIVKVPGNDKTVGSASSAHSVSNAAATDCCVDRSTPPASFFYPTSTWNTEHVRYQRSPSLSDSYRLLLVDNTQADFVMPVKGKVISEFGMRSGHAHTGIDIKLKSGDPVYCAFAGVVRMAKPYSSYGNVVVVRHYNGLETVYSHLSSISVKPNQAVEAGALLGKGGRTGRATTDHLHFEVRFLSEPFNPREIINFDNFELRANYYSITPSILTDSFKSTAKPTTTPSVSTNSGDGDYTTHTVQKGNTLYNISRLYKTTVKEICLLNGLNESAILSIGQKLKVPAIK